MSRAFSLAGFEVTLIGRFWVTPEVNCARAIPRLRAGNDGNQLACDADTAAIKGALRPLELSRTLERRLRRQRHGTVTGLL
jgi:hypothetical protein